MASVRVFVDDAVLGRLPPVCARTGAPADGKLRVEQAIGGIGAGWLLVFLGPPGWLALVVLAASMRHETLTVRLPYCASAVEHELRLARVRFMGALGAVGFTIAALVLASPLKEFGAVAAVAAFTVAAIAHVRLAFVRIGIRLDASRRWLTLSGVHLGFATAVEALHDGVATP